MNFKISPLVRRLIKSLPVLCILPLTACSNSRSQLPDSLGTHLFTSVKLPEKLTFAGEDVPMDYFDVRESLDRELLSTVYFHSQTIRYIKNVPRYFSIIEPILKSNGVPEDFKYLCVAESGFDPKAYSPSKAAVFGNCLNQRQREWFGS